MTPDSSRADLHCHSTASQVSKLGVQRALGLPECATPPEEAYALAKRRGMDFFTITDHDTIEGVLELGDRPDVFASEELTVWFRGEPQAVHVLCLGITPDDHDWLEAHNDDVERCAEYLHDNDITCALAHPFYAVEAPLTPRHRRRLAELFPIWEVRNGSRARELNAPAAVYIETHGGVGVAGTDDHAGVDIGRTFTETPPARTPGEFLAHIRAGRCTPRGEQGSAAKWAHSAMALALRALGPAADQAPDPLAVLTMGERVMREGDVRRGAIGADVKPADASALLHAWLHSVDLDALGRDGLLELMQADDFSHGALFRRARRAHERRLRGAVETAIAGIEAGGSPLAAAGALFDACVPAVPYAPAAAFLGREKAKLVARESEPPRVAIVADAIGGVHGVAHALEQIRERGVPGFDVEVIGTDRNVDRRLSAVAEVDVPFYAGLKLGVPSVPAVVEAVAEGRYDLVHVCSPGPAGLGALLVAKATGRPVVASHHTELAAYAGLRSGDAGLEQFANVALGAFYAQADRVLSPSLASDDALAALGVPRERIGRWDRGVDLERFTAAKRDPARVGDGRIDVLYAGRLTKEKGVELLADTFELAHAREPRLRLVLAGGGPEEGWLRERLGDRARFEGFLDGEELPRAYASADLFLFASRTDTFGQVILEAHASGLPVVAVAEGGPVGLVRDGVTGLLRPPDAEALADAVLDLAGAPLVRERMARAALAEVAGRSWEAALGRLATGYRAAIARVASQTGGRRAA